MLYFISVHFTIGFIPNILLSNMPMLPHMKITGNMPIKILFKIQLTILNIIIGKILLLDEVMAGLNPTEVDELIALLKEVNRQGVSARSIHLSDG